MKALLIGVMVAATASGAVLVWGLTLPPVVSARAERVIRAAQPRVWAVLTDWARQPEWRTDVVKVEVSAADRFTEYPRQGKPIQFRVKASEAPGRLELEMSGGVEGVYQVELSAAGPMGTRVVETYEVRYPTTLGRIAGRVFFDLQKFADEYLNALAREAEKGN